MINLLPLYSHARVYTVPPTCACCRGNLLKYFEWYVHLAASTPEALNKAQISDSEPFLAFKFDKEVRCQYGELSCRL